MSLVALERLKEALAIADTNADDVLQRALDAATTWIENYTGRSFSISAEAEKRYFYAAKTGMVRVPDLQAVTTIKVDKNGDRGFAQIVVASDYELWPLTGPPYSEIRSWPMATYTLPTGYQIEIDATWGYGATVPAGVEQACLVLGARYYKRNEAPFGILQNVDLGQYTRISQEDPDVISLLAPYRAESATSQDWIMV